LIGLRELCQTDGEVTLDVVAKPVMSAEQFGPPSANRIWFGPFELNVAERSLGKADDAILLGGRAFDILLALLDRPGAIVSKEELIAKVWPGVTVDEVSLRVHLSALRKALGERKFGDKYITNVPGRGYCFAAPVMREAAEPDKGDTFSKFSNLPPALRRMIGRDDVLREIHARLQTDRLLTILGTGGIGKTTVAVAAAHAASSDFPDGAFFIDLAAVKDSERVADAIATAIGLDQRFPDLEGALFEHLRTRKALIILDSCEHHTEKTAELADAILQRTPHVAILATSREALRTAGERLFCLHPLDCPPEGAGRTATQVLAYAAARLFVERVSARGQEFTLTDEEAPLVAELCRKLDGIALAIELAAGRAAIFGAKDTAARLGSRLDLLKFGRRTANPRHQTLRAALDWSHDHLSEVERIAVRRVAIFAGHFTLEAALAVAMEEGVGPADIADAVGSLVDKSLIAVRIESRGARYRLLDTTRYYALEKLVASGEHDCIAERHADYSIRLLEANSIHLFDLNSSEDSAEAMRDYLGNVRAALEWSFGPNGNDRTAIRLAAAASQLFLAMSLLLECRNWMEKAIDRVAPDCDPRHQTEVYASLALSLMFTEGNSEKVREAFQTALTLAEQHGDASRQLRLLSGLSMYFHRTIDAAGTLELALRSETVARKTGSPGDVALADSMLGAAYYILGDHLRAQEHLGRALHSAPRHRQFNAVQYLFDLRTLSLICLTRSHWFTGNFDRAAGYAETTIEEPERSGHPIALSRALTLTMPFYFWIDDLRRVGQNLSRLELIAEKYSLAPFRAVALGLKGQYLIRVGRAMEGIQHLRDGLEKLRGQRYEMLKTDFISELAVSLARQNQRMEALALVDESIAAQVKARRPLHLPALFLAKGLVFASGDLPDTGSAKLCFERAMMVARQQTALSFELRAGLEVARMWIGRGEVQKAHGLIGSIYNQFTEGFATPDLILAKRMLEQTSVPVPQAE
jgi:predicted ATPase/DNA-binding winged helix-turn-helix (wHTH) protein